MYSLLTGPPGDISDIIIPPDTITACSFVVQWSRPSSDPVCDPVQYTVTVATGGMLIITDSTTITHYNVIGLNDNTVYNVGVTASNNAGSIGSVNNVRIMTNSNGESIYQTCAYIFIKSPFIIMTLHYV